MSIIMIIDCNSIEVILIIRGLLTATIQQLSRPSLKKRQGQNVLALERVWKGIIQARPVPSSFVQDFFSLSMLCIAPIVSFRTRVASNFLLFFLRRRNCVLTFSRRVIIWCSV
jgi:hypothetical protein